MKRAGDVPKWLERMSAFFPLFHLLLISFLVYKVGFWSTLPIIYLVPPLLWRPVRFVWGQPQGVSYLGHKTEKGNGWWVAYHLQYIFNSFHFLEQFLMFFPGGYSLWLRLWGSKIGKQVNWTPECRLVDRTHLSIGSRVLIGNRSYISGHILKKKGDRYVLYVKGVEIGDDVVLGYSVTLSPGVKVASKAFIEAGTGVYPNENIDGEINE